jgi:hydroxyacylglutathione hydrolase
VIFTQYYLDCLSHASYLIGDESTGRAVVVDPRRDIDEYLRDAEAAGLTIELVIETHFHADFLSGHLELADATGAVIAYGSKAETEFESRKLADGERISLGTVELEVLHTPGHTPGHVVIFHDGGKLAFVGDVIFQGSIGRTDFPRGNHADLIASITQKLWPLGEDMRFVPGHGPMSTFGQERQHNSFVSDKVLKSS